MESKDYAKNLVEKIEKENVDTLDIEDIFNTLLDLPDEEFKIISPFILEEVQRSVNSADTKIFLAQGANASGLAAEDLVLTYHELLDQMQTLDISQNKKDFIKQVIGSICNAINDTEGIAKKLVEIPFEICHPDAKVPQYAHISDSGMDLYALEDYTIKPGETMLIPTGIKFALPPGYELQVRPKSGRALKTKLRVANTPGTIDAGYRDELKVIIENVEPPIKDITYEQNENGKLEITSILYGSSYTIGKGEKFAQIVLSEVPKISLFQVDKVSELGEDRGGGFGSTGLQ